MGLLNYLKKDKTSEKTQPKAILSDHLTDPHQIKFHLEEIIKERNFVSLRLDDGPVPYATMLLSLDEGEEPGIFMDSVVPEEGNVLTKTSKKITLNYVFKGINFGFESRYLGMEKDKFIAFKISIPQEIKKVDNRQSVRVRPSFAEPIYILFEEHDVEEAADISDGGLAFYTKRIIEKGEIYDNFVFILPPDNRKMHTHAEVVRFLKEAAPSRRDKHICCVEFLDMKPSQRETIVKYIFQRIRQILQQKLEVED